MTHAGASDRDQILDVLATYCQTVDDGRFDEWEQIWTVDATFTVVGQTHQGRGALRSFIEAAQPPHLRGKHVLVNPIVNVEGDSATASSDFLFLARADGGGATVTQVGRYRDRLVRTADGWKISARDITLGFPAAD